MNRNDCSRSQSPLHNAPHSYRSKITGHRWAKRKGAGLAVPVVRIVQAGVFEQWKKANGRWGGQNKMPRCRSDRLIADALESLATP